MALTIVQSEYSSSLNGARSAIASVIDATLLCASCSFDLVEKQGFELINAGYDGTNYWFIYQKDFKNRKT